MDPRCIRCSRRLGQNTELAHLPLGRRVAFDPAKGRLWVICTQCQQWNLAPIEERWEAIAECERLAEVAEAKASSSGIGLAQTDSGLEMVRVGGLSHNDIVNWRYGKRLVRRQRLLAWTARALAGVALALGLRAGIAGGSFVLGTYVACAALVWLSFVWREPPRLAPLSVDLGDERIWIWPWQVRNILLDAEHPTQSPAVVLPRGGRRFIDFKAAQFLAGILPKLNGADCARSSIGAAVVRVTEAEKERPSQTSAQHTGSRRRSHRAAQPETRVRPWQRLIITGSRIPLVDLAPERRLALEMAVTEEVEQRHLACEAEMRSDEWASEEIVAAIADDLLLPEEITERLADIRAHGNPHTPAAPTDDGPRPKRSNER